MFEVCLANRRQQDDSTPLRQLEDVNLEDLVTYLN